MSILVASDPFLSLKMDMAITKGIQSLARSSFSRPAVLVYIRRLWPNTMALTVKTYTQMASLWTVSRECLGGKSSNRFQGPLEYRKSKPSSKSLINQINQCWKELKISRVHLFNFYRCPGEISEPEPSEHLLWTRSEARLYTYVFSEWARTCVVHGKAATNPQSHPKHHAAIF